MTRSRLVTLLAVILASLGVAVTAAWAGFPNIQRFEDPELVYGSSGSDPATTAVLTTTSTSTSSFSDPRVYVGGIVVTGVKEGVETVLSTSYSAVYVCVNGGGNVPSAANKTTLLGTLETSGAFPATRNGKATGSLLTQPLPTAAEASATSGFACPSGQSLEFDRVVFSNLVLAAEGERIELDVTLASQPVHG